MDSALCLILCDAPALYLRATASKEPGRATGDFPATGREAGILDRLKLSGFNGVCGVVDAFHKGV